MKSLKVLAIIGLVWSVLSWICLVAFDNAVDYEAGIGWGLMAVMYLIAISIVAIVQVNKHKETK